MAEPLYAEHSALYKMCVSIVRAENNDQPGYDVASAVAAVDSLLDELGSIEAVHTHLRMVGDDA